MKYGQRSKSTYTYSHVDMQRGHRRPHCLHRCTVQRKPGGSDVCIDTYILHSLCESQLIDPYISDYYFFTKQIYPCMSFLTFF